MDTFKIAEPLWDGCLEKPDIARIVNDTFFVVYQYTPHINSSDTVYYSVLGRNIFYQDSVFMGPEIILYQGINNYYSTHGYKNPFIAGGDSSYLLLVRDFTINPAFVQSIYSFLNKTGSIVYEYSANPGTGLYSLDFESFFYIVDHLEPGWGGDTMYLFKFDESGNLVEKSSFYDLVTTEFFPQIQEENNYIAVAFPYNSLLIHFFHTVDTFITTFNTYSPSDVIFKLLSTPYYFYLFVVNNDTLKGQRFFFNGTPKDTSFITIYIEDSPFNNLDGIWDGTRFFLIYEKNNDIYGLFVDTTMSVKVDEKYVKKQENIRLSSLILRNLKFFNNKVFSLYTITGNRIDSNLPPSGIYLMRDRKGRKTKVLIFR
jgi:hypothetical protein